MRSVLIHALLALTGLVLAYRTWTRPQLEASAPSDEVVLLECEPERLESIEAEFATHYVRIAPTRAQAAGEPAAREHWITVDRKDPEPSPATPQAPAPEPAKKPARALDPSAPVTFVANAKLSEVIAAVAPLRALRDLGVLADAQRADFGLAEPETRLRVSCGGRTLALEVGGRTFGAGDRYALHTESGRAYLLPAKLMLDLQSAQQRFMQAELHDFTLADASAIELRSGGKQRRLLHRDRAQRERAQWVDAAEPDRRNELFGNWLERVAKLRAKLYLARGQEPGDDLQVDKSAPKPVLSMRFELEGKPHATLELVRVDTAEGNFYYARSEATRVWVAVFDSLAKQVEDDVGLVVGGDGGSLTSEPSQAPDAPVPAQP